MNNSLCIFERVAKAGFGFFFLTIAIGLIISGFTVLPFFGFFLAVPVLLLAIYFFSAHLNRSCQIE